MMKETKCNQAKKKAGRVVPVDGGHPTRGKKGSGAEKNSHVDGSKKKADGSKKADDGVNAVTAYGHVASPAKGKKRSGAEKANKADGSHKKHGDSSNKKAGGHVRRKVTAPQPSATKSPSQQDPSKKDSSKIQPATETEEIIDPEKDIRNITGHDPSDMTEVQESNLKGFISQFESIGVKALLDEFETIKQYNLSPMPKVAHEANHAKNRYKDIFCIDPTRVVLHDGKAGDYIHANFIKGTPFVNKFIATQGPIESSVNDFWRLVVQEKVGYIFMLCSIMELGKKKCEVYYPEIEGESKMYLDIKVTLLTKGEDSHFINSKFIVEAPGKRKQYLYHHFWKSWPDHGVPLTALAGLRLLRHARLTNFSTIVHCSAGVGRTGTLIALEWLLQTILNQPPPYDMKEMLKFMRNQRAHAIQTAPQYAYIAFAVFRLFAHKDAANNPTFYKYSSALQALTGFKFDGGANVPPAVPK